MNKYDYLKPYYNKTRPFRNHFFKLSIKEIREGEEILGQTFPSQLKEFYNEIGEGFLVCPHHLKDDEEYIFSSTNRILWPTVAASFYQKIIEYHQNTGEEWEEPIECEGYYMALDTVDMLQPGDLPFFEIGDSSSFMVMKLNSDNPNAVWSDCGVKIENSFEHFIFRLYYESPSYYGPIMVNYYADKKK